jgi:pimeloyl-ACP methyl ester carboxylesterase
LKGKGGFHSFATIVKLEGRNLSLKTSFPEPSFYLTNGINMAVYEQGDGYPVIIAHGFPELAYSWRYQIPVLAEAGYRVIAPDQRGYGLTDKPEQVEAYDMQHLCGDMAGLLDALNIEKAMFIGHDWGGPVVWNMPLLHPGRVSGVVSLSVPFMPRTDSDPVAMLEQFFGPEHYIVHFNRQPGVADKAFADDPRRLFNNIFRKHMWSGKSASSESVSYDVSLMAVLELTDPPGEPLMSDEEMDVFVEAFSKGGFTGPINWYRNITRNWEASEGVKQYIDLPCGMIFGEYDIVPKGGDVSACVPNLETVTFESGHWIQQERPDETNEFLLSWLQRHTPSS